MAKRGLGQDRGGRSRYAPFVRLDHAVLDHPAYRALDPYAKEALTFLCRGYRGPKGWKVMASVRHAMKGTGRSNERVRKSLAELVETGFIVAAEPGHMGADGHGTGTRWRMTFLPAIGIGETHEYRAIWEAREAAKKTAARSARRYKGCSARRYKEIAEAPEGVARGDTRNGPKAPEGVARGDTILRDLPGGMLPGEWRVDDWHAAQAVARRKPWAKPRLVAFDLPNINHPEPAPRTFAVLAAPGVVRRVGVRTDRSPASTAEPAEPVANKGVGA